MIWATLIIGSIAGFGLVLILNELRPKQPKLASALENLRAESVEVSRGSFKERLGRSILASPFEFLSVPAKDLSLVQMTPLQHATRQATVGIFAAGMILLAAVVLVFLAGLPGTMLIIAIPVALAFAGIMMVATNLTVTQLAAEKRLEFSRSVASFIELVAVDRKSGSSAGTALKRASDSADGWVFIRIQQALKLAELRSAQPWDALKDLSQEIDVKELGELADTMSMSGAEGISVAEQLRARGNALRVELLNNMKTEANAASERTTIPAALIGGIVMLIIAVPPITRLIGA